MRSDWRAATLTERQRSLCEFAHRLALDSDGTSREDLEALRTRAGLDDRGILDLVLVVAYYSYVNRIASALGVPLEPERAGGA